MGNFVHDLRLAIRQLKSRPWFALTAILTLAIGIGVNAVAFTVVNGLIFKGPELAADGVGRIVTTPGGDEMGDASLAEYGRFGEATHGALDVAAEGRLAMAWQHDGQTDTAWVLAVSPNYFSMVSATPLAGRVSVDASGDGSLAVVVGERFWRRSLDGVALAGLRLRLNNVDVHVAGVLPESFRGPAGIYSPDVWIPLDQIQSFHTAANLSRRDWRWLFVMGRLVPGTTVPEIQGRVDAAAAAMAHDWPDTHGHRGARFRLLGEGNSELRGLSRAAAVAMGIIGLVLLLACFNVANLLLARAVERERDMGIRTALGASAARLVRMVVTEGLVVAGIAGAAALIVANWTQTIVGSFAIPIEQPQHIDFALDPAVVIFVGLLVIVAGVLPGLWPAIISARVEPARVLASQGGSAAAGRRSPMRGWLVAAQIAGSTAFLVVAALFGQSYSRLALADMGFARDRLLVAEFEPAGHGYGRDQTARYLDALLARVGALPGVASVAVADRAPFFIGFDRRTAVASMQSPCSGEECPKVATMAVGPDYFKTMGIRLAAGRELDPVRTTEVLVNQPLASQYWLDNGGVGQVLRVGDRGVPMTIAGITARTHTRGLDREQPTLYVRLGPEHLDGPLTLVARTAGPPETLIRPFGEAAQALDPNVSMTSLQTMEARLAVQLWPFRTVGWLFSICGGLALVLGTVGLAGVVIYSVSRRRREFGVRLAIGAVPGDLVRDVRSGCSYRAWSAASCSRQPPHGSRRRLSSASTYLTR
jgi:predicted permease